MKYVSAAVMTVLGAFLGFVASAQPDSPLRLVRTIALPDVQGSIERMAVDLKEQRVFVAARDNNSVEVVDLKSGTRTHRITGLSEPQGIAYVPRLNRLLVTNRGDGTMGLFEGRSFGLVSSIKVGDHLGNVRYSSSVKRAFVGYGEGAISTIDPASGKILGTVALSAHPEGFEAEKTGSRIYVNVPGASEVAVIDRIKREVVGRWPLAAFRSNFPMALDEAHGRLFIGTRQPERLVVLDTKSGRMIADFLCSKDAGDLFFDPASGRIYLSCGEGFVEVFEQRSADMYFHVATIATAPGAGSSLLVPEWRLFFVSVPPQHDSAASLMVYETQPPRAFASSREKEIKRD
jgi:DNA-binding beta-propeller fold protein YncE